MSPQGLPGASLEFLGLPRAPQGGSPWALPGAHQGSLGLTKAGTARWRSALPRGIISVSKAHHLFVRFANHTNVTPP